jgi:hypothetical protein
MLWQLMWLGRSSCLLASELVLPLRRLLLGAGLPRMGLHSLPLLMSTSTLDGEAGVRLWCHRPW